MTPEQIAEIRTFADQLWLGHSYCEDSWYSCPLSEEGCANVYETECNCNQAEREAAKRNIDALLAAVDRLKSDCCVTAENGAFSYETVYCGRHGTQL